MSLPDWVRNGWLREHQASRSEIRDLLAIVERDLADSARGDVSTDWRFNIAYNAALKAATAALAAEGYRPARGGDHHFRVIQSLRETVGSDATFVNTFEAFRKKRNVAEYDRVGTISEAEATTMREMAVRLRDDVSTWLRQERPDLAPLE